MADDDDLNFNLNLDNKDFLKSAKDALDAIKNIGDPNSLSGLIGALGKATPYLIGIAASVWGVKESFDAVFDGERIAAINKEFELLSDNVGISYKDLEAGLESANKGLLTHEELLTMANKALMELQTGYEKIPQILELARKASLLTGKDVQDTFNGMIDAVARGNTMFLRHQGIVIDQKKAYEDYAKSIGVSVSELSLAGKQQAVLNALLEQGNQKLAGVTDDIAPVSTAWKGLMTTIKEVWASFATFMDTVFGPALAATINGANKFIHFLESIGYAGLHMGAQMKEAAEGVKALNAVTDTKKSINQDQYAKDRISAEKEILAARKQRVADEQKLAYLENDTGKAFDEAEVQRKKEIEQQYIDNKKKYKEQHEQGVLQGSEFEKLNAENLKDFKLKKFEEESQVEDKRRDAIIAHDNYIADHSKSAAASAAAGWNASAISTTESLKKSSNAGRVAFNSMNKGAQDAFKAIGNGSKNAADAMKGFILGAIADQATAQGEYLLASGIGTFDPIQIAEGGVLIALGSALSAAGGSSSVSSGGGGGGGGSASSASASSSGSSAVMSSTTPPTPAQSMQLVVQGNIFDSDATRTRLMEMMRQSQDMQDFRLTQVSS